MMRNSLLFLFLACSLLCFSGQSLAGQVQVFKALEEGVSPMQLRSQAMDEGFAQAVLEEAQIMLSNGLREERAALLKEYFVGHAKPYIQGYKIISSQIFDSGLSLVLDVRVDRKTLRDDLKGMGLFATAQAVQTASVIWPEGLSEEEILALQKLVSLTGLENVKGASPSFALEYGAEKGTYKGRLAYDGQEWISINADMAAAWFTLWPRFFNRPQSAVAKNAGQSLVVSGWFSPDGVMEFDRVLKKWDAAVQNAELVDLDMQSTGVGATWSLVILNQDRLNTLLNSFLPQRGLSFHLTEGGSK